MIRRILTQLPQVKLRGLGQASQRHIVSPKHWRAYKSNVQASAGRSFDVLKANFLRNIKKLMVDFHHYGDEIVLLGEIDKEVTKAYKKAYLLGLKSSGLTVYQKNVTFKKTSLPSLDVDESYWLSKSIFDKLEELKGILKSEGKDLLYLIEIELLRYYQYGRIVGAPIYSFVYFNCDSGKEECNYLIGNSPWPREKIEDFNPCCRFKIIPKTAGEYRKRLSDGW